MRINEVLTPYVQALPTLLFMLVIGLAVAAIAFVAWRYVLVSRVEIEGDIITFFNWLGNPYATGKLSNAREMKPQTYQVASSIRVQTDQGIGKAYGNLNKYGLLLRLLRANGPAVGPEPKPAFAFAFKKTTGSLNSGSRFSSQSLSPGDAPAPAWMTDSKTPRVALGQESKSPEQFPETAADSESQSHQPHYIPELRTYGYRGTYQQFFGVIWTTFVVVWECIAGASAFKNPSQLLQTLGIILFVAFSFGGIGAWLLMSSSNENIELGPEGLTWTDWLGNLRLKCPLEDIVDCNSAHDSEGGGTLAIYTIHGTVNVRNSIKGYADLQANLKRILGK
jgi:hypothetical protein